MRDTRRILRMLLLLEKIWNKYPDMRLGQLIVNISRTSDPFYVEDYDLEKWMGEIIVRGWKND